MKNCYFLVSVFVLMSCVLKAQDGQKRAPISGQLKTKSLSPQNQVILPDSLKNETIEHCEAVIEAIDRKVDYIKNDQDENAKALESGWYIQMAETRARMVARKEAIILINQQSK